MDITKIYCHIGIHCYHTIGKDVIIKIGLKKHGTFPDKEKFKKYDYKEKCCYCGKIRLKNYNLYEL